MNNNTKCARFYCFEEIVMIIFSPIKKVLSLRSLMKISRPQELYCCNFFKVLGIVSKNRCIMVFMYALSLPAN